MNRAWGVMAAVVLATVAAGEAVAAAEVTRADVARAYQRFERAYAKHTPPAGPARTEIHQRFDRVARAYVQQGLPGCVALLNELTLKTLAAAGLGEEDLVGRRWAYSRSLEVEPAVGSASEWPSVLQVRLDALWPEAECFSPQADVWQVRLVSAVGDELQAATLLPGEADVALRLAADPLPPGLYRVQLVCGDEVMADRGWPVLARPVASIQADYLRRLAELSPQERGADAKALGICRMRIERLTRMQGSTVSRPMLDELPQWIAEIENELSALIRGEDPYAGRRGECWRVLLADDGPTTVPLRTYVPAKLPPGPRPLLVAFHGAAGDESMFFSGYGDGQLKELADRHGLIVACPQTYPFVNRPELFDRLLESLAADYAIDRQRVLVVGHSLGAITACNLAEHRPEAITAACCLAGAMPLPADVPIPPVRVYSTDLDRIVPAAGIEFFLGPSLAAERPELDYLRLPDLGHTLMVNHILPEAVGWVLAQQPRPATAE